MVHLRLLPLLAALTTLTLASTARASHPAGVWALVDEATVIIEPGMDDPTMIRIDGLFMVSNQKPNFEQYPGYGEPQYGYMYYNCSEKEIATCLMEWKELQAIAGSDDNCRGWGDNSLPDNGSVYAGPQLPLVPDLYPLSMGILTGFTPCDALKAWAQEFPGTTSDGESDGTSTSTTSDTSTDGSAGTTETSGHTSDHSSTEPPNTTEDTDAGQTGAATGGEQETANVATEGDTGGPTEGSTGAGGTTAADTGGSSSAGAETGTPANDDKGCACHSAGDPARDVPGALLTLLGLGLLPPPPRLSPCRCGATVRATPGSSRSR
jgi:hypothetical protein